VKVLIIGHNVFSKTNNMGKTMLSYFKDFTPEEIAQFYIQDKLPSDGTVCRNYFQFTDKDAIRSILPFHQQGRIVTEILEPQHRQTNNTGAVQSLYQYGRKRNAFVYTARNAVWRLAHWKTDELISWLRDFDPDVIFFMAGDYGFMYRITLEIQEMLRKPLVVCCVDDYYLYNRNERSVLGRFQHTAYMKTVHKVMERASCILTISDSMGAAYHELFGKPCFTLHTSSGKRCSERTDVQEKVAYFGNLGYKRYEQLVRIGRTIKSLDLPRTRGVDVYSGEKNPEHLRGLTEENGVFFHGEIAAAEVGTYMDECLAIIHTESFDPQIQQMIKYSVSTKIADSLMNGPCLIAYGPEGIASIDYLKANHAAYVITRPEDLESGLKEILTNAALRAEIVTNARKLAEKNHDEAVNPKKVREWLQTAAEDWK
jgi:hypothetical protein